MAPQNITPKQLQLLILIYRYRFLNRIQLQQFLNHKDTKRINTWLKDLCEKQLLGRHYSKTFKENIKPAVYYLQTKSKPFLENLETTDQHSLKRVYTEKIRSQKFIEHCLALGNISLHLQNSTDKEKVSLFTKTDLASHDYLPDSKPDAYIALQNGANTSRYFLEIIDTDMPRFKIRSKINKYIDYLESKQWETYTGYLFPKLLLVCPNKIIEEYLHKYIPEILDDRECSFEIFLSQVLPIKWAMAGTKATSNDD